MRFTARPLGLHRRYRHASVRLRLELLESRILLAGDSIDAELASTGSEDTFTAALVANTAPKLDTTGSPRLTTVPLNAFDNPGTLVRDILRRAKYFDLAQAPAYYPEPISDPDSGAVAGIAITAADTTHGTWMYSNDNGTTWLSLDTPSDTAARLLAVDGLSRVRFVATPGFSGDVAAGITFRAWDQTEGSIGGSLNATTFGGTSSLSQEVDTASITVAPTERLLTGLATIGDSIAGAYEFVPSRNTTRAWIEQLEIGRGINLGRFQYEPWGAYRVPGREFMWGSAPPLSSTIVEGVSAQIAAGDVTFVHYAFGQLHLAGRYAAIYNGTLSGAALDQVIDNAIAETAYALDAFAAAGDIKLVLQNWGDAGQAPLFRQMFPDATRRQVVLDATQKGNAKLQELADARCIPLIEFMDIGLLLSGPEPLLIGGVEINKDQYRDFHPDPTHFLEDALHPGSVVMGLVANMFIEAANRAYGAGIVPFSDQEILISAGITPPPTDELTYYNISDLVHFDYLPTAIDDAAETVEGTPVTLNLLENDHDPEGQPLVLAAITSPARGSVVTHADGTATYTPDDGFYGIDTFSYDVGDGRDCFTRASVTVQVKKAPQLVEIDIKPGSGTDSINLASQGVIPVTLFGSTSFDAAMVDIDSVLFSGASVSSHVWDDLNGDGHIDLVLHFRVQDTKLSDLYTQLLVNADSSIDGVLDAGVSSRQATALSLTGSLTTGDAFHGFDTAELFFSGKTLRALLSDLALLGMI